MKQQITEKEWNSLSFEAKEQLIKWTTSKGYPDLLSIGQMIEFLEANAQYEFHIFRRVVDWKIIYHNLQYGKDLGGELCDALWKAVKDILNHEN